MIDSASHLDPWSWVAINRRKPNPADAKRVTAATYEQAQRLAVTALQCRVEDVWVEVVREGESVVEVIARARETSAKRAAARKGRAA